MRRLSITLAVFLSVFAAWWIYSAPPAYLIPAPPHQFGPVPEALLAVKTSDDHIAQHAHRAANGLPAHDEIVLQEHLGRAFVTGMDRWIWQVDLASGKAEHVAPTTMYPAGARLMPGTDDTLLFCNTRLDHEVYADTAQVGLYELTLSTKTIRPLALRVPLPPPMTPPIPGNQGNVYTADKAPPLAFKDMNDSNSRPIAFCNDIDISRDGKRVYMSEPFDYPGASAGAGAVPEAILLAKNGRLWQFDLEQGTARLVAQNYNFIDGILIDQEVDATGKEISVLVTETPKSRLSRFYVSGPKAGQDQLLWDNLPGLPDGIDRDPEGRVWVGLIKDRTKAATWIHANPWIKPFLLRLPRSLLPITKPTSIIAFSPDASQALFYTHHNGSTVGDISVVVPGKDTLYLPSFERSSEGLISMPYPPQLKSGVKK